VGSGGRAGAGAAAGEVSERLMSDMDMVASIVATLCTAGADRAGARAGGRQLPAHWGLG
jgi:hypothetical protein